LSAALAAGATGAALGLTLIVAIGAQNAFVLRQGLRREHVGPVVLLAWQGWPVCWANARPWLSG